MNIIGIILLLFISVCAMLAVGFVVLLIGMLVSDWLASSNDILSRWKKK